MAVKEYKARAAFFRKVEIYSDLEEHGIRHHWEDYQRYSQKRWSAYERSLVPLYGITPHGMVPTDGAFKLHHLRLCRWFASR